MLDLATGSGRSNQAGSQHLKAIAEVAAEAEWGLAPRLLPVLIARFDSGQQVAVGRLTADRQGLRWGVVPDVAGSPMASRLGVG